MELLAFIIGIIAAFYAGYKYEKVLGLMESLKTDLGKKRDVEEVKHTSNTSNSILDPFDEIQKAKFAHDELMRKLNE